MIVAIIPARGGSKAVPRKNIRLLADKPLITHTILDAQEAKLVDRVYVSTDDDEIAHVSEEFGANVISRPAALATSTVTSESALTHALAKIEKEDITPKLIVFLQCTSPIRTGQDIDDAIAQLRVEQADSLLSVSPSHRFLWKNKGGIGKSINYDYRKRPRRQDMQPQFVENGSIYVFKTWVLREFGNRLGGKIVLFEMKPEAQLEIDTLLDFEIAEVLMKSNSQTKKDNSSRKGAEPQRTRKVF